MKTEFDVNTWRSYYDQVQILGQYLKDSRPNIDGDPAKFKISIEERNRVESEIDELLKMCDNYLDKCKVYPKEPKWYYHRDNPITWVSSEKFQFSKLMTRKKYMTIAI
jgi:hypothetical protein